MMSAFDFMELNRRMTVKRHSSQGQPGVPTMLAELSVASVETIFHRAALMAFGQCSFAEYQSMVSEKLGATQQMAFAAMMSGATTAALLAPWHRAAQQNSQRLRSK